MVRPGSTGRDRGRQVVTRTRASMLLATALTVGGCAGLLEGSPVPDPEAFPGISGQLGRFGVDVARYTAGDAGCDDSSLSPTAIRFTADGLDQATPLVLRIYIFRNRETWQRRLADVDTCATAWAQDPATFEIVQVSPYVVAGQGPWAPEFEAALRKALGEAAGSGG